MKSVLFFILTFLSLSIYAQNLPVNEKTGKITYMEVVDATGLKPQQLYDIVKEWANKKGYEIDVDEKGQKLKFNGVLKLSYPGVRSTLEDGMVYFTFTADLKDGKYRYIFTEFVHKGEPKNGSGGKLELKNAECGPNKMKASAWVKIKNTTNAKIEDVVVDLKKKVKEVQNDPESDDNW